MPLLEEFGFQGSFFIPGKTFTTHQLLDVNKIHYILASARKIENLVADLKERINYYRGSEYAVESADELWKRYAVANRFDDSGTIFFKRVLQNALPENQIRTMKRHGRNGRSSYNPCNICSCG